MIQARVSLHLSCENLGISDEKPRAQIFISAIYLYLQTDAPLTLPLENFTLQGLATTTHVLFQ